MNQRVCRGTALAMALGTTFFYPLLAPPAHRIDSRHLRLIRPWMTDAEVENIFGVPPGDYGWAKGDISTPLLVLGETMHGKYDMARLHLNDGRGTALCGVPQFFDDPAGRVGGPARWCDLKVWNSRHGGFCVVSEHGRVITAYSVDGAELPWVVLWRWWKAK